MRARLAALLLALLVCVPPAIPRRGDAQGGAVPPASAPFGPAPVARSRRGVVASATAEATDSGAAILAAGGNAVDAAVATALALAVTYPSAGNLAGGGFAVGRTPGGELWALDFRETAPAGTWRNSFLGPDGRARPRASTTGGLAVGTPGTLRGLEALHRRYGKLPWARLFAPAIRLAREGFRVPAGLHGILAAYEADLARDPAASKIFLSDERALPAGSLLVQEDLARTLETVAEKGADGFHRGGIARKIAAFVRSTGGVLTEEDIAGYQAEWRPPFVFDDGPYRLVTMPLPSSGGFLLASILGQLRFARGSIADRDAAATIHLVVEAERRAYADRNSFLGDPACVDVPVAMLLAPVRLAALGFSIDPSRATPSSAIAGGAWPKEPDQTTHFTTATADGGVVSVTYTLNDTLGNHTVVPGVGVLLNNEMDDFATEPGAPNGYGLVQGESNAVRAGARPLSSMTPTIVLEGGRPRLALGSPGGAVIPTTVLQVYLNALVRGEPLGEAVAARRFHHQHLPDRIELETGVFPEDVKAALRAMGHALFERSSRYTEGKIGRVHAIAFERDGSLTAAADPRGYGAARGAEDAARDAVPGRPLP
ncbi:MAG TPA: gamma-glutamyltransferase [Thermoanaerobaculia bacterium]|nr:gamma-glutamyltransferase [Thermoanaerobaculia bacterium]